MAAGRQHTGVEPRLRRTGQAKHERPHRVAQRGEPPGIDAGPLHQVADGLHDVGHHEAAHAPTHLFGLHVSIVLARTILALRVALALADRVIGQHRGASPGVENTGIKRVPTVLIATVAVDHDQPGHLCRGLEYGAVHDGRHAQAVGGGIADTLGNHAGRNFDLPVVLRLERRQRIAHEERRANPAALLFKRGRGCRDQGKKENRRE